MDTHERYHVPARTRFPHSTNVCVYSRIQPSDGSRYCNDAPSFAVAGCQRGSTAEFQAHVHCRLSCPTATLLINIELAHGTAFGYLKAIYIQQEIDFILTPRSIRLELKPRFFHGTPHSSSTPTLEPNPPPVWMVTCMSARCLSQLPCIVCCMST